MRSIWTSSLLAIILLCGTVLSAQSTANCTYSRFAYPGTQTILTWASGLNKWGSIVGTAQKQSSGVLGYVRYGDGSFKSYQVNDHPTQFYHRNDNGDTVGFYIDSNNRKRGLLLSGSNKQTTIDYPGAKDTVLTGINKYGTIVGYYTDSSGHFKGFKRWSNGTFQSVTIPNMSDLRPMDINDSGVISGATGQGAQSMFTVSGFPGVLGRSWMILNIQTAARNCSA